MPPTELVDPTLVQNSSDPKPLQLFSAVLDTYVSVGYRCGYEGAMQNLLESLVPLAEEHLRFSPTARRNVYAFIEFLERHLERVSSESGYVADGLGI